MRDLWLLKQATVTPTINADTMYIAYCAPRDINEDTSSIPVSRQPLIHYIKTNNPKLQGYLLACAKYRREIAAIQQYIPGWIPTPPTPFKGDL